MKLTRDIIEEELQHLYFATGATMFFSKPVLKVAAANDPWFTRFKTVIDESHWTPQEALERAVPGAKAASVISFVCPNSQEAREGNRRETAMPCVHWARIRSFGDIALQNMGRLLARFLQANGCQAVAPFLQDDYMQATKIFRSHWSERHVAFVAGIGTFGLSGGLITEYGVAHRLGSVVTDLELTPDVRDYGDDFMAWCTKCGACARRCPAGSIGKTLAERDKAKCSFYQKNIVCANREDTYGWSDMPLGCGLCQTGVPCEYRRPQA